jgi:ribonuclease P protein component
MFTLGKKERIKHLSAIRSLFDGGKSIVAFPVRAIYHIRKQEENQPVASILVSVPKRHFKHAVDRNRVKRQLREAYRKNKSELVDRMTAQHPGETLCVAFVWIDGRQAATSRVDYCMQQLLQRIGERL